MKNQVEAVRFPAKVEVALLHEDRTWDTEIVELFKAESESFENAVARWFAEATQQENYRKIVQACVYDIPNGSEDK